MPLVGPENGKEKKRKMNLILHRIRYDLCISTLLFQATKNIHSLLCAHSHPLKQDREYNYSMSKVMKYDCEVVLSIPISCFLLSKAAN